MAAAALSSPHLTLDVPSNHDTPNSAGMLHYYDEPAHLSLAGDNYDDGPTRGLGTGDGPGLVTPVDNTRLTLSDDDGKCGSDGHSGTCLGLMHQGTPSPRILCLDMDETLGSFGPFCIAAKIWRHFEGSFPPPQIAVAKHLSQGAFRPGMKELLNTAASLKQSGHLDEIVIFTSASNEGGYVDYVRQCVELFSNLPPGTVSRIISKEHSTMPAPDGATMKDLGILVDNKSYPGSQPGDARNCIIVDDKPHNICQGTNVCLSVRPYDQWVSPMELLEHLPGWDRRASQECIEHAGGKLPDIQVPDSIADTKTGLSLAAVVHDAKQYAPKPWSDTLAADTDLFHTASRIISRFAPQ